MEKINIIKFGSSTLVKVSDNGEVIIDQEIMRQLGQVMNGINEHVIIVSSGAVAFGKSNDKLLFIPDEIIRKRLLAALGNPDLTKSWQQSFQL